MNATPSNGHTNGNRHTSATADERSIDRRRFIKTGAAVGVGAAAFIGCRHCIATCPCGVRTNVRGKFYADVLPDCAEPANRGNTGEILTHTYGRLFNLRDAENLHRLL